VSHQKPLLLDTHVWLWLALGTSSRMSSSVLKKIDQAGQTVGVLVSIVSVWEIALLAAKQRVVLPVSLHEWMSLALKRAEITLIGLNDVATIIDSVNLPGQFHADPADRFLVATARTQQATLVTYDEKIIEYAKAGHVNVLGVTI